MPLDLPPLGDRKDFHASLHDLEFSILDALCARYQASRSKVLGALLRRYAEEDVERLLIEPRKR